mgnify:CR=1 FL=1
MNYSNIVKQMVGKPVPATMLENIDWNRYQVLEPNERDRQLQQLAESIRNRIIGNGEPSNLLLG